MILSKPCRVLLVDPTHTYQVLANDCFPLAAGFLASYLTSRLGSDVDVRIEKYPDAALDVLRSFRPHVLLLSNYLWNCELSALIAGVAKRELAGVLVVQGGPNFPLDADARRAYLSRHRDVDVYVVGEGEEAVAQLLEDVLASNGSIAGLRKSGRLLSCCYLDGDQLMTGAVLPRLQNLDTIPSPYLNGLLDKFFDGRLYPQIETNRGCPFTCTFCQQGTDYFTKVRYYDLERIKEELDYIGARIKERSPGVHVLGIVDSNFGMFERDAAIAGHIGRIQADSGWPTFVEATTGKNQSARVLHAAELMRGSLTVLNAVQSMDERVLLQIKRSNIKLSAYAEIQEEVRRKGLQSKAEIILGLPGETLASHLETIKKLIEAGIQRINTYQLMMLMGTEMELGSSRREFGIQTRWRVLPRSFGEYDGRKALEIEEVGVSTSTLSFDDYRKARKIHLLLNIFFNEWLYREPLEYLKARGISPFTWVMALEAGLVSAPPPVRDLVESFLEETERELFATEEDARTFYADPENFPKLRDGEIGSNLLFGYWARALFTCFDEMTTYAFDTIRVVIAAAERGLTDSVHAEVDELERFMRSRLVFGRALARQLEPTEDVFHYDFSRWIGSGFSGSLAEHRRETRLRFALPDARRQVVLDSLDLWGTSLVGLTKMMTRLYVNDFRAELGAGSELHA